ncbi:MAG: ribosome biogenesis factor YjgA [Myxococcota bacterium]
MSTPEDDDRSGDEAPKTAPVQPRPRRLSPSEMFPEEEEHEAPPDVFDNDVRRSHRQHKQQVDAYARLAKDLVDLAPHKRGALDLPAELEQAIESCVPLRKAARVRELRRIATILRRVDARNLRDQLDSLGSIDRAAVQQEKALERWRERLIAEGDAALSEFVQAYPAADRQQLRQLVRTAGKGERTKGKAVAAYRKLLRELRAAADAPTP